MRVRYNAVLWRADGGGTRIGSSVTQVRYPIGRNVGARVRGTEGRGARYVVRTRRQLEEAEATGGGLSGIWEGIVTLSPFLKFTSS